MKQEYLFDDEHSFVHKLEEIVDSGTPRKAIEVYTPVPVHEVDEILQEKPTFVRFFAVTGALAGCIGGFLLTYYTNWRYPLIVSGKPYFNILPYAVIMFELTILIGSIASLLGFLALSRLPSLPLIRQPVDYGNKFAIVVGRGKFTDRLGRPEEPRKEHPHREPLPQGERGYVSGHLDD